MSDDEVSKSKVLFVDDEARILRSLNAAFNFEPNVEVHTANSAKAALKMIEKEEFHVIVSDQRMPEITGVELLEQVRELSPNTMRILLTGYADIDAIVGSINDGEVFRYITKPWKTKELKSAILQASSIAQEAQLTVIPGKGKNNGKNELILEKEISERPGVLVIDSNKSQHRISSYIKTTFSSECPVFMAHSVNHMIDILSNHRIAVVAACINIGQDDLKSLLRLLKKEHPLVNTIAIADRADSSDAIEFINKGQIFRYIPRPVTQGRLKLSVQSGIEYYHRCKSNPVLMARHIVDSVKAEHDEAPLLGRFLSAMSRVTHRQGGAPRIR